MGKTATKFGILVGLGAVIVACSSSTSTTTPRASTDGGACGGFASTDPQCNACLMTSCCTEGTTCNGDTACVAITDCVQSCTDDTCTAGCLAANPGGVTDFNSLTGCVNNECASSCGASATGGNDAGACGVTFSTSACQTCFTSACCSQGTACASNADCTALDSCVGACTSGDVTCENACVTAHPNGTDALNALGNCLSGQCSAACGLAEADGGTQCGGFSSTDFCQDTCLLNTCCAQAAACSQNAACLTLFTCVTACAPTDTACITACGNTNAGGVADFNALSTCQGSCPCGTVDGGIAADGGSADGG